MSAWINIPPGDAALRVRRAGIVIPLVGHIGELVRYGDQVNRIGQGGIARNGSTGLLLQRAVGADRERKNLAGVR